MREVTDRDVLAVDLDGTVVRVNSFPFFVRFLVGQLLLRVQIRALLRLVAAGMRRKLRLAGHADLKQVVCEVAGAVPPGRRERWAADLLARHGNAEVIELLRGWPGPRLLTTAAPEVYAGMIAGLLEVAETHGSRVVDGVLVDNKGDAKVVRLLESGLTGVTLFVTDDVVLDAPMARVADRVLEVSGSGRMTDWVAAQPGGS